MLLILNLKNVPEIYEKIYIILYSESDVFINVH